ncbi:MAG: ATP-binding protein [Desulfobacteria bacterium]
MNSKETLSPPTAELATHDFTAEQAIPLPRSLKQVGKVVYWEGSPNFNDIFVLLDPGYEVKPGQFLAVWHRRDSDTLTVVQVSNCGEVNPNEAPHLAVARERLGLSPGYASEGVSTRIFRLASCETIEEFEVQERAGTWTSTAAHAPEALARAGDPVVLLPEGLAIETIGGLRDPNSGVNIGATYGPDSVPVTMKPGMLQLHTGIFGNPGKGKSYFSGILVEEAVAWGVPTLVLDVNGETVEAAKSLGGQIIKLPDPSKFGMSLNSITAPELISIIPNVKPNSQYADLIESSHDQLRNEHKNNPITFNELRQRITDNGAAGNIVRTSVNIAVARVSVLEKDPLITRDHFNFIEELQKHRLIVLDCRFLSLRQTRLIAASAARVLQSYGQLMARKAEKGNDKKAEEGNDKAAAKWFALLFIDEAHAIVPNSEDVVSTQVLYELARMGRHVRTGLILSSQSPSDLDPSVLKRLQTRFVFALEKDQLRTIGGVVADLSEDILNQLPKLPRGVCAVSGTSEVVRHGFLLQVKTRTTPVGGSTPPVFEGREKKNGRDKK